MLLLIIIVVDLLVMAEVELEHDNDDMMENEGDVRADNAMQRRSHQQLGIRENRTGGLNCGILEILSMVRLLKLSANIVRRC